MDIKVKQRIIGGLVIVCVVLQVVAFLVYQSKPTQQVRLSAKIPPVPEKHKNLLEFNTSPSVVTVQSHQHQPGQPYFSKVKVTHHHASTVTGANPPKQKMLLVTPHASRLVSTPAPSKVLKTDRVKATSIQASLPEKVEKKSSPSATQSKNSAHIKNSKVAEHQNKTKKIKVAKKNAAHKKAAIPTQAWVIQLGVFSNQSNANALVKQLQKKSFDAYSKVLVRKGASDLQAVFVGPDVSRKKLERVKQSLENTLHIQGIIKKYRL